LEEWAQANQIAFTSREELVTHLKVKALYDGIVGEVNQSLARHETLKKVLLVPEEFTAETGTLTATMKVRRRAVEERYRQRITELYEEAETAGVEREKALSRSV
jgi:long-chain acyl-CoA synthetase